MSRHLRSARLRRRGPGRLPKLDPQNTLVLPAAAITPAGVLPRVAQKPLGSAITPASALPLVTQKPLVKAGAAVNIVQVQQQGQNSGSGLVSTITTTFTAATAGNLLLLVMTGNQLGLTPSGWTLAKSAIDDTGTYVFYKVAAGGETTVAATFTSGSFGMCTWFAEYSGLTATPFDNEASNLPGSTASLSSGTTATLTQADELCIAVAGLNADRTVSAWSNSFVAQTSQLGTHGTWRSSLGVASKVVTVTTAVESTATLTGTATNPSGIMVTFLATVTLGGGVGPSITPASAFTRLTQKPLAGAATPASTLVKVVAKLLNGTVAPGSALTKLFATALTAGVTPTASVVRLVSKLLAGTVTPAGDLNVPHYFVLIGAALQPITQVDLGPSMHTSNEKRRANALQEHFTQLNSQPNIWQLTDGTFTEDQPWSLDLVRKVYYGGHLNIVTEAERNELLAAGYVVVNLAGDP